MKKYTTRFYFKNGLVMVLRDWTLREMWRYVRKYHGIKNVEFWEEVKK